MHSAFQNLTKNIKNTKSLIAIYDVCGNVFSYHSDIKEYFGASPEGEPIWSFLTKIGAISKEDACEIEAVTKALDGEYSFYTKEYIFSDGRAHTLVFTYLDGKVTISISKAPAAYAKKLDELTGLCSRNDFCAEIGRINKSNPDKEYVLYYFDIIKFKAINDIYGFAEGDKLLTYIADKLTSGDFPIVLACREASDRFACLAEVSEAEADDMIVAMIKEFRTYPLTYEVSFNVGIYAVKKTDDEGNVMLDKAMLAQSVIKGSYTEYINHYTEKLLEQTISEQEIFGDMAAALAERHFIIHYQPIYDNTTRMIVSAEALVRWNHPTKGLISPARFIPVFEKNGFITNLDFYVFREVAAFLRRSIDEDLFLVPISVNFSKKDIFYPRFLETLEEIRKEYDIPARYLRIEITESVFIDSNDAVNEILSKLKNAGYTIELDDFGSGYSSLNVLKDLDIDIIKLDLRFLQNNAENERGGTILQSVVNMAKWLGTPIIAEGVETKEQVSFLGGIGCKYHQGFFYSRPLTEEDYVALLSAGNIGDIVKEMNLIDNFNSNKFWDPTSQETLLFNSFVGAAAIFNYNQKTKEIEILRVNQKYLHEFEMNLSEYDIVNSDPARTLDEENHAKYIAALDKAIAEGGEQECETKREIRSECCGSETFYIRSNFTVIGSSGNLFLFYAMIRNVTREKRALEAMNFNEQGFKNVIEQANIYYWEYTIATREMRPCFRCMRDLNLPPVVRNYPESAFEAGIFPPDYHDMYRDWMKQIEGGVKSLEAVIPLTPGRVPFIVRYTTEFDENGHPFKAYGSATLVVD